MTGSVARMGKDMRTRHQGVYVRHQKRCGVFRERRCDCEPGYIARVWDRAQHRQIPSPTLRSIEAAKNWRTDTIAKLSRGELPDVRSDLRVGKAVERFIEASREGKVLTKHGKRYKSNAIRDLEGALMVHVVPELGGKRLADVRRGDVQRLVDDLAPRLSGSRVRTVVNALRSLYRWAQDRDYVSHDPAGRVRLPAMDATPRDRVADPAEFERLLAPLEPPDALVYALAAYGTARSQEIRLLRWSDVDLDAGVLYLGADSDGRKTSSAQRQVPLVRALSSRLRAEFLRQGRPDGDRLVCAPRKASASGLLSCEGVAKRARGAWGWRWIDGKWIPSTDAPLTPIGLHESRHTAASWLNAAGVNPKVASALMGHSTPERAAAALAGAAAITLQRYTHALPGDLPRARDQLEDYLTAALERADRAAK